MPLIPTLLLFTVRSPYLLRAKNPASCFPQLVVEFCCFRVSFWDIKEAVDGLRGFIVLESIDPLLSRYRLALPKDPLFKVFLIQ